MDKGPNSIIDDLSELKFDFLLPMGAIRENHPDAKFMVRTSLLQPPSGVKATTSTKQVGLNIVVNDKVLERVLVN